MPGICKSSAARSSLSVALLLGSAAVALSGCAAKPEAFGDQGVVAYWAWGEVSTNIPPQFDQKTIAVAAEEAMRSKGYIIAGRTSLDADPCRIFGRPGRADGFAETIVTVSSSGGGTRIAVFVRPTGDEGESKSILRALLSRLGLYGREQHTANAGYAQVR